MTPTQALEELLAALEAGSVNATDDLNGVATPSVVVSNAGIDVAGIGRRQLPATFRLALLAGAWSSAGAGRELATLSGAVLGILARLEGWAVGDLTSSQTIRVAGSDYLGAFVTTQRMIDI